MRPEDVQRLDPAGPAVRTGGSILALNEMVREALREMILQGRYRPGTRLVEGRLAAEFGVSRNPVREALKALSTEGIVTIEPRRGAIVSEISENEVEELIELRSALEGIGARFAARRKSSTTAAEMRRILEQGEEAAVAGDLPSLSKLNESFHDLLSRAGNNRFLGEYMRTMRTKTQWLFEDISYERASESWVEHAAILRAVLAGDEELAGLLAGRHVTRVGNELIGFRLERASSNGKGMPAVPNGPDGGSAPPFKRGPS